MRLWLYLSLRCYAHRASAAFRAGRRSRDKEVQQLQEQLAEAKWWLTQRPAWENVWAPTGRDDR